jgi:hypothetical protein
MRPQRGAPQRRQQALVDVPAPSHKIDYQYRHRKTQANLSQSRVPIMVLMSRDISIPGHLRRAEQAAASARSSRGMGRQATVGAVVVVVVAAQTPS